MQKTKSELESWCLGWTRTPQTVLKAFIDAGLCSDQEPSRAQLRLFNSPTQSTNSDPADGLINSPPVTGEPWIERWCGSGMLKGSSIWTADNLGCHKNMIEHFGGDEETHASVRRIVAAHNTALRSTPDARAKALREAAEVVRNTPFPKQATQNLEQFAAAFQREKCAHAILALLSQEPTP